MTFMNAIDRMLSTGRAIFDLLAQSGIPQEEGLTAIEIVHAAEQAKWMEDKFGIRLTTK
jgi:hypothetical protein